MKKLVISLISLMCCFLSCVAETRGYFSLNVETFEKQLSNDQIICVDVRTPEEYAQGHIAGAINIDIRNPEFVKRLEATLPKEKTIAVYCRSGKRSKMAAEILVKTGYRAIELNAGILGWTKDGKATTKEEVDFFTTSNGTLVYLYCIKHGSVKMKIGKRWLYVDPVTKAVEPETDYSALPKADAILLTHEHYDHLDSVAIRQLTKEKTVLVVNPRCGELLGGAGTVMNNGDVKTIVDKWKLEAVPAYNTSAEKQQFHPKGRDNGYVLTISGLRIYIAGDTEDIEEMKNLKDIDIAFLPCNLPYTMTPEQLANAAKVIKPKVLFPYHYGQTDIQQVVKLLENSNIDVRIRQYQ